MKIISSCGEIVGSFLVCVIGFYVGVWLLITGSAELELFKLTLGIVLITSTLVGLGLFVLYKISGLVDWRHRNTPGDYPDKECDHDWVAYDIVYDDHSFTPGSYYGTYHCRKCGASREV